jgi:hypothetical protein
MEDGYDAGGTGWSLSLKMFEKAAFKLYSPEGHSLEFKL